MEGESQFPNRHTIRLQGFDYSLAGAYFVTIRTHHSRKCLSTVTDGHLFISAVGRIVQNTWLELPNHYPRVRIDAFVIMPDHVHGIIVLGDDVEQGVVSGQGKVYGLPEIVRAFKSFSSRRINAYQNTTGKPFWQRGYFERIIRNEDEWGKIREYILANPCNWPKEEKPDFL